MSNSKDTITNIETKVVIKKKEKKNSRKIIELR